MRVTLRALSLGNFAIGTGAFVVPGMLVPLSQGLDVSVVSAGQLLTAYAIAYAVGSPLLVSLTSHIPRRKLLLIGIGVFTLANVLSALAMNFWLLFAARILAAWGAAVFTPTASTVAVATAAPEGRGKALATVFMGLSLSQVIGIPIGTLLGYALGWRAVFLVVAVVALGTAVVLARVVPGHLMGQKVSLQSWGAMLKNTPLTLAISATLLQFVGQFSIYTYIGPWLNTSLGLEATGISVMLWCYGLASTIGGVLGGWSADRFGVVPTLFAILLTLALSLAGMSLTAGMMIGTAVALAVWGIAGFAFNAPQQSRLVTLAPEALGVVLALNASALYVGTATGGAVGGIIVSHSGMAELGWVGSGFTLLAVGALLGSVLLRKRIEQQQLHTR